MTAKEINEYMAQILAEDYYSFSPEESELWNTSVIKRAQKMTLGQAVQNLNH